MYPDLATVTETGLGGQQQRGHYWCAALVDGTAVRVYITAKVQTLKIPLLKAGQVIHVQRHPHEPTNCSVDVSDIEWVSPSKLARRIAESA
jgi:hypothetical protein